MNNILILEYKMHCKTNGIYKKQGKGDYLSPAHNMSAISSIRAIKCYCKINKL